MSRSTITSKYQTTVPKAIRDQLGLGPTDVLRWEVVGDAIRVSVDSPAFLRHRGAIATPPGSVLDDVKAARRLRGSTRF